MTLCAPGRHLPALTYSRPFRLPVPFRRLFHVRCWECDLDLTFTVEAEARAAQSRLLASQDLV